MGDNRDFFALDWIKSELDTTLNSARRGLEAYAESADEAALRACLAFLHQVNGTLVMLELKGIAVLSAEMESLAEAMLENSLGRDVAVQQLLMQGLLQLPAFLEDIQEGRADRRQVVLPLANEMRTIRGGDPFSDYDASQGNLYQRPSTEALDQFDRMDGREKTAKIRKAYQHVLLSVIKGERLDSALTTLAKVAVGMERLCQGTPISTLFRAFGGFVESLSQGDAHLEKSVIKLLRQIDAELKTIALGGRDALNQPVRLDLIRRLIDAANERNYVSAKLDQISGAIDLADKAEPTGVSSRDAASTAATALREELLQIRDKLDLSVRGEHVELDKLKELAEPLKKIGSTLAVLGYESSRSLIMDQTERLSTFASDGRVSEADLLGVASSLLQVEENLLRITSSRSDESVIQATNSLIGEAQIAVLQEVRNGLEKIKLHVVQFASSQWDIEHLADVPDLLMGTRGALAMIPLSRPAAFLERCANFVQVVWSGGVKPGWQTLDIFADAISGIDYYLERLSENTVPQADDILALVEQSLTRLESLVPTNNLSAEVISQSKTVELLEPDLLETPQSSESAEELLTIKVNQQEKEPTIIGAPVDIGVIPHQHEEPIDRSVEALAQTVEKNIHVEVAQIEFEPSLETSTPIEEVKPEVVVSTDIPENVEPVRERPDEEIIEIFGEEVGEVLESFDKYLPILANDNKEQNRHEALIELRRGFHTLKGSGRIVTADLLAEVSWSIENMLNRLLDGILQRNEHILQIVEEARQLVPLLCSAFERDQEECVDASADLIERADILASGGIPESPDAEAVSEILEDIVGATSSNPSNQSQNAELLVESSSASDDSASWTDDFSMFDEEAVDYMVVLRDFIDRNVDSDKVLLDQDVVRALHTLNGSAGVVGIDPVSAVVGPLYDVMGRLDERGSDLNSDHFVFLQQSVYCLESVLSELRDGRNSEEDGVMYAAEADRLIAEMSAVKSVSILGLDSVPALLELHNYLTHWRGGAEDLDQRDTILVALREIGAHAKESGFGSIVTLSDALRASLLRLKDAVLEEHAFNLLDRAQEVLVSSFDCVAAHQQLPNVDELVDDLFELKSAEKVQIDEVISSDAIVNDLAVPTNISIESDDSFNLDELDIALDQDSVDVPIEMIAENVGKADSTQAVILASESVEAEDPFDIGDLDFGLDEGSVEDYEATDTSTSVQTDIPADGFIESDDLFNLDNLDLGLDEITAKAAAEETPVFEDTASVEEAHRELMADEVLEQDSTDKIDAGQDEYKSIEDIDYIVPMDEMVSTAEEFNPDNSDLEQGEAPVDSAVEEPPKFGGLAFDAVEAAKIEDIAEHDAPLNAADLAADASEHESLDIPEDLDAEIIEIFFEEADELVETMDQSVNEWVLDSANEMHLENMLRVLHTLKGGARLSGLGKLGDVTHDFESFLVGLQNRDFEPDKAFFSNVLSQVDEVTNLIALYKKAISAPLDEIIPVSAAGTESNAEIDAPDKRDERQNIEELNTSGSSIEAEELLESSASADQLTQVDSIGVAQDFDIPLVKQDETVEKDALLQASVVTAIQPTSETT
ncbi:MAG: Hpt domain-containing protein, partial [Pseudomonadales bacterium]|nr:Hpt domain-containing protein [Pseudomonadales bacterium]